MEYLKNLFLVFTTLITIYYFLKSYKQGLIVYLLFMCICGITGFSRPIYYEEFILPFLLVLTIGSLNRDGIYISFKWIILIIIFIGTTLINNNPIDSYDVLFIFGFFLLALGKNLFKDDIYVVKVLSVFWLYVLCRCIFVISSMGTDVLSVAMDSESRVVNYSFGDADFVLDPNYLGFYAGMGAVLSFMYLKYKSVLDSVLHLDFLKNKISVYFIGIVGCVEVFLTIRGLSRGMLLALICALFTFLIYLKNSKQLIYMGIILFILGVILSKTSVYDMYMMRFSIDDGGAGRYDIWTFILRHVYELGFIPFFFGVGLNYPWWKFMAMLASRDIFSTHSSIITVFLVSGFLGVIFLFVYIIKNLIWAYKNTTYLNHVKVVLLVFCVIGMASIEPLHFTWGWIPLVIGCSVKKY